MFEDYSLQSQVQEQQDNPIEALSPQIRIYNRNFHLRRLKHQQLEEQLQKEIHQLAQTPKITPNSYVILVQKMEHELRALLQQYGQNQIDFEQFQNIFKTLGRFEELPNEQQRLELELLETQLWLLLIEYHIEKTEVSKQQLQSLFSIIFCPYSLKYNEVMTLLERTFSDIQQSRINYLEQYPQTKDEILDLSGIVKLWLKIKRNRIMVGQKKEVKPQKKPSFQPEINAKSREYAQKSLQKYLTSKRFDSLAHSKLNELSGYISAGKQLSYHQILYKRGLQKEQMLKTSRQKVEAKEKERTLSSNEVKQLVSNLYVKKQKREDVDQLKRKEDQQIKLCTFHPQTITYEKQKRSATPTIKNYQKDIERLEKGRKDKQHLKQAYANLGRVKHKATGSPPSFLEREQPILILDIALDGERVQLRLRNNQQPRLVAKKFVMSHGLDESMQQVLQAVIEEQLASL